MDKLSAVSVPSCRLVKQNHGLHAKFTVLNTAGNGSTKLV